MSKAFIIRFLVVFLMLNGIAQAQSVWPGDMNNNGIVNCADVLYWSVANGKTGPIRASQGIVWQAYPMPGAWQWSFHGEEGINYAYADANGDGKVDNQDVETAVQNNFFKSRSTTAADRFSSISPLATTKLELSANESSANSGETVTFDIAFNGNISLNNRSFQGIALVISYNPELVDPTSFSFEKSAELDPSNTFSYVFAKNNPAKGEVEIAVVRTRRTDLLSYGARKLVHFSFRIADGANAQNLNVGVKNVIYCDDELTPHPISVNNLANQVVVGGGGEPTPCPAVIDPVCGSDGKVYLNSCYAQAAGVDYTPGICNPNCVDPTRINPDAVCPAVYDPVCGCNGVTYANACVAEAAGVRKWTSGPCGQNAEDCYDPTLVINSEYTSVNQNTGVITFSYPEIYDPVCACNGVTYDNSFMAEAHGITFYTKGVCNPACVDPAQMDPDAICTLEYNPVCGCNGVTYGNACVAEAAGVVSYTPGVCGAVSSWCNKAVPISCGDFLSSESTANAGNNISQYPCSSKAYTGPENVYVINKTTAGDLQIGLEIITSGLDLDLFLLASTCNQVTCLKSSTTNNTQTNNEGIILEDAPIGTYYLVVDGASAGQYRLELSCGYLDCNDAVQITCGQIYNGNNANGGDNVSLYGCSGNVLNVENNGPEMVHYFTVTQAGNVTISLTNMTANLELFLLGACDRGACIDFSQNAGTANEEITAYLESGTYYVVIDGYNGAVSNYKLKVDCTSACNLNMNLSAANAGCGQNNGSISIAVSGGSPSYLISLTGPVSGSYTTNSSNSVIGDLPAGTYKVTVTDCKGCKVTKEVTVVSSGNLTAQTTVTNASCGQSGSVKVTVYNGTSPYKIYLSGALEAVFQSNSSIFTLTELIPGSYTLQIVDANGCSVTKTVTIGQSGSNFYFTTTPNPAACESPGSISIKTFNGTAPYKIKVTGPKSGTATSSSSTFNIVNLPAGTYSITIEDANGCSYTQTSTVTTNELAFAIITQEGSCTEPGDVIVSISSGKPTFMISWSGPISGSVSTNSTSYTLPDLPAGTYTITIKDANWCELSKTVQISASTGGFDVVLVPQNGMCEANGVIGVDIIGGKKPYHVYWTGPVNGDTYLNDTWFDIRDLDAGTYTVKVVDANGCEVVKTAQITIAENNLSIGAALASGSCGSNNTIVVSITGGKPTYVVMWNGPVSGQASTNGNSFEILNLPPGTYNIQVKDANWCVAFKTITILPSTTSLFSASVTNSICEMPGAIKLTFTSGMPDYKITWSGPQSGSATTGNSMYNIENLPAGSYSITVKDAKGCIETQTIQVLSTEGSLSVNASLIVNQCGQYNTIWVDITGGTPTYVITWEGPISGSMSTNNQGFEIMDLPPGKYTITVKDANWCVASVMIMVFETPGNLFEATPENGVCEGPGSIKLHFTGGTAPYTVNWTGPKTGSATVDGTMYEIPNLPAGTYTINVTDKNNCTDSEMVQISVAESNLGVTASQISSACGPTGRIKVNITGGSPAYTITWNGPVNGSVSTNGTMYEIPDLPAGSYTISIKDVNWCFVSTTVQIQNAPADLFSAVPMPRICETLGSITLNFTGGSPVYQISWTGPTPGSASSSGSVFVIENLTEGSYTVKVTDANGCMSTKTVTVGYSEGGISIETSLIANNCGQYNTIWLDIFGGMAPYVVVWEGPVNDSDTIQTAAYEIMDLPPGKYTITVKDKNWCYVSTMVTVFDTPANIFSATPNNGACNQDGSISLTLTGTPNYTVAWSGQETGSATVMTNSYTISSLSAGNYSITVTDSKGCIETENVTLTGGGAGNLAATITGVNGSGSTLGKINVNITAGAAPFTIALSGAASTSITANALGLVEISNLPAGQYTVTVTDNNGCSVSQQLAIAITEGIITITASQTGNTCGTTGAILVNISGGTPNYTVSWLGGGVNGSAVTASTSITIQNLPAGTYTVTVTGQNGISDSETVQVFANPSALSISASVTNGTCGQNGQMQVSISGGTGPFTVEWTGPTSNSATVAGSSYTISDLPSGTYTVKVTENGGCSQTKMMSITNTNQQPVANFSYSVNGTTVTFINQSSPGTYSWMFGDNTSANTSNPSHIYSNNASYNVCLTVTNSCGSQTICKTVTVGVPSSTALIDVKDLSGGTGTTIYVPVTIENCIANALVSFAGSLSLSNPAVATITGILPGSMSPQYNADNRTFSYFNNSGGGVPCGPGQILFYVVVQITGNQGTSTVLTITGAPLSIELGGMSNGTPSSVPYTISSGIVTVANTAKIIGQVTTYWGVGLPSVEVTATHGTTSQMKVTDINGHYELAALPMGEMHTVQPKRYTPAENGLSTYALFAGQRFILGLEPLEINSPYQIIAGDANCDGRFTTLDLFLIQRIIVGTSPNFGDCPSWVFVKAGDSMPEHLNATNVFPYHNCDTLMLMKDTTSNFIGVKVGDILGHANPNAIVGVQTEPRSAGKLHLLATNRPLKSGELLEIPVTSHDFLQIASYQMGLSFDWNKLEFVDIVPSENPVLAKLAVGAAEVANGALRLSWFDLRGEGVTINSDEVLFTLRFRALADIQELANALKLSSRFIRAEAYNNNAERLDVELNVTGSIALLGSEQPAISYKLYQNAPNPFRQETYIGFDLPADMYADLIIFDQFGKMVRTFSGNYARGYNRIEIPKETLSNGVYYYTLRTADFADTKSMIVIE